MTTVQPPKAAWQMRLFPLLTALGSVLIMLAFAVGLFVLAPTAASYWGGNAKATRDAAEAGSSLLAQLRTLNAIPRWLAPLKFVGVASFMIGIALEFSTIPSLLKNRGQVMSLCFPHIVRLGK